MRCNGIAHSHRTAAFGLEYSDSIGSDRDESYEKTTFGAQHPLA